jgi:DNA-binding CsgD family transcriptional regulator
VLCAKQMRSRDANVCRETSRETRGLIMLDGAGELLYLDTAARQILCYPGRAASDAEERKEILRRVRSEVLDGHHGSQNQIFITSGRRQYGCSIFVSDEFSPNSAIVSIVLVRRSRRNEDLRRSCEQHRLTPRESQAVLLLTKGLTTKQMAPQMNISANTVKNFIRLIMVKLGVTTRSGIVGKISSRN